MKKLLLFTTGFPYGKGEKSFILPELEVLRKEYDITIVACGSKKILSDKNNYTKLDDKISVYYVDAGFRYESISDYLLVTRYFVRAIMSPIWWREIIEILHTRKNIVQRILDSSKFFISSDRYRTLLIKANILPLDEEVLVYTFWNTTFTMALLRMRDRFLKINIVSRMHGFDLYNDRLKGKRQPFKTYTDEKLDAIFFICDEGYKYYLEQFAQDKSSDKYHVCRLGVSEKEKRNPDNEGSAFELVSCSNIIPLKRVELIILALSEISNEYKIHWTHFGDGEKKEYIQSLAKEKLSLKPNIDYDIVGFVPNADIMEYYKNCHVDCFITTTSREGLPVSIMEALSFGIPIIATDVNGNYEEIEQNGILLSSNPSSKEVAEAIVKMINLPNTEKKRMRDNSYLLWKNKFDCKKNVDEFCKILKKYYPD